MQINLSGHNIEITEPLRDYVTNKFSKLERFFEHINNVHVVLSVEKTVQIAEATLHVNAGELHASAEHETLYAAIDLLIDKLARQLNKHKDKLNKQ